MKKTFLIKSIALSLILVFTMSISMSFANDAPDIQVSALEAKNAAIFQIVMDMQNFKDTNWSDKKVKIQEPIEIFDATGSLHSYLFNLTTDGNPAGFIEVSPYVDDYPILSFSREGSVIEPLQEAKSKSEANPTRENIVKTEKIVTYSPGSFALKVDYSDGSADIFTNFETITRTKSDNEAVKKDNIKRTINQNARTLRETINAQISALPPNYNGWTTNLSFETGTGSGYYRGGVPDMKQIYNSLWTGPSGCSPTTAASIMRYWGSNGYPKLTAGLSNEQIISKLRIEMSTNNNGDTPTTNA